MRGFGIFEIKLPLRPATAHRPDSGLLPRFLCGNYQGPSASSFPAQDARNQMSIEKNKWQHPGGKLREQGADKLDDAELLAILISPGTKGHPAEAIARELIKRFDSLAGLANQPLERLLEIKGLGDVKILRIAAALEIGRRTASEIIREKEEQTK